LGVFLPVGLIPSGSKKRWVKKKVIGLNLANFLNHGGNHFQGLEKGGLV